MGTQRYGISLKVFNSITYKLAQQTSEISTVEHEKRNSISPTNHVLFCLLYKHLTNKKNLPQFKFSGNPYKALQLT